ncbi:hypothetical protein Tco_0168876 [Tanacetum coccineum]
MDSSSQNVVSHWQNIIFIMCFEPVSNCVTVETYSAGETSPDSFAKANPYPRAVLDHCISSKMNSIGVTGLAISLPLCLVDALGRVEEDCMYDSSWIECSLLLSTAAHEYIRRQIWTDKDALSQIFIIRFSVKVRRKPNATEKIFPGPSIVDALLTSCLKCYAFCAICG